MMKAENKKGLHCEKGAVTVFLSCILVIMIVFETFIIDATKVITAKNISDDAGRLSSNAVMTHYNKKLYHGYGLFVFDGTEAESTQIAQKYFNENLSPSGSSNALVNPFNIKASVNVSYDPTSKLSNRAVFEHQIIDQMKYSYDFTKEIESGDFNGKYMNMDEYFECFNAKIAYDDKLYQIYLSMQEAMDILQKKNGEIKVELIPRVIKELDETIVLGKELPALYTAYENSITRIPSHYQSKMKNYGQQTKKLYSEQKIENMKKYLQKTYDDIQEKKRKREAGDTSITEEELENVELDGNKMNYLYNNTIATLSKARIHNYIYAPVDIDMLDGNPENFYLFSNVSNRTLPSISKSDNFFRDMYPGRVMYYNDDGTGSNVYGYQHYIYGYSERMSTVLYTTLRAYNNYQKESRKTVKEITEIAAGIDAEDNDLLITEYITNFFNNISNNILGENRSELMGVTLNGNDLHGSTEYNVNSVKSMCENEYVITGRGVGLECGDEIKRMVWKMLFTETFFQEVYYDDMYKEKKDGLINRFGSDKMAFPFISDMYTVGEICAETTDMRNKFLSHKKGEGYQYLTSGYGIDYGYANYMELFTFWALKKNRNAVFQRMQTLIEANMVYSGESFSFDSAYSGMTITANVNLYTSFMRKDASYTGGSYANNSSGRYNFTYTDCLVY